MGPLKLIRKFLLLEIFLIYQTSHFLASGEIPAKDEEFIRNANSWFPKDKELEGFLQIEGYEAGNNEPLIIEERDPILTDRQYRVLRQSKSNPTTYTEHTVYVR